MKIITKITAVALVAAAAMLSPLGISAEKLVILHTNDTHSQIEPDRNGAGGILQRKAVMDSVRMAERNVIAIDAGDGVQGSLYFKFFRGEVDYPLMNLVGYDIRILGNHEFDNGLEELAQAWKKVKGARLSANYDFSKTSAKGLFEPYVVRKVGGRKIGFIGLNVNPESLIIENNYKGMEYSDPLRKADELAEMLKKKKGCDLVVAVTHIGYRMAPGEPSDLLLAERSKDIDIIIGGHSHTLVDPVHPELNPFLVENSEGRPVLVAQTGKSGRYVGKISIDLDLLDDPDRAKAIGYELIPVSDRFADEQLDPKMKEVLAPYKARVDSVNSHRIATVRGFMDGNSPTGAFPNWVGDFGLWYGNLKMDSLKNTGRDMRPLDLAIMNVGGIRSSWAEGMLSEGKVLETFPFSNRFVVMDISGRALREALAVAAKRGGEAVSGGTIVVMDPEGEIEHILINGEELDDDRLYRLGTIDYLAWGNDGLRTLADGEWVYEDEPEIAGAYLRYINLLDSLGIPVQGDTAPRFVLSTRQEPVNP